MTGFPIYRPRRLRATENLRSLIRETSLSVKDLIFPLFVVPGENVKNEIETLKNNYQWSVDRVMEAVDEAVELGIPAVLLFGLPSYKDEEGSSAWDDNEPVQRASKAIKAKYPEMVVITDACFCEYTTHGHCGILTPDCASVDNDKTLPNLAKLAVSQARCGADIAYSAKFASAYYGPFRAAADSAPGKGDRKGYQMDPGNSDEAMREIALDIEEGADIVMVKPALAYQDVTRRAHETFNRPLCVMKSASSWKPCSVSSGPAPR